jgi:ABC-type dipeptide/oligopeptide/nickel transport system permease component
MGTALLVSSLVVLGGLVTDIAYGLLDPRIRWS